MHSLLRWGSGTQSVAAYLAGPAPHAADFGGGPAHQNVVPVAAGGDRISVVVEVPLAIWLETVLHSGTSNIFPGSFTVRLPEEIAKAIPVTVIGIAARHRIPPADYLFFGAVSGLGTGPRRATRAAFTSRTTTAVRTDCRHWT